MRPFIAALILCATPALADDWQVLDGAGVREALTDRKLTYDSGWQTFSATGKTLYNAGRDSWGTWDVRGDQYCSQWPPQGAWDCYDMETNGTDVRFVGSHNDVTVGRFID